MCRQRMRRKRWASFTAAEGVEGFPEVSEIEVMRHFTRLSTWNYAIDLGMYPLGSCTMKYNPRVNEYVARLAGIATEHPYQPQELSQGCLKILQLLEKCLLEITGMDAITLQPAAGAQGELTGLLLIRAYHEKHGNPRKIVLIPDSAHGTNPATAVIAGYGVQNIKSDAQARSTWRICDEQVTADVAALMLTNPSTLGIFEQQIPEIAEILHAKGALLYMDGANMNALAGVTRPGDLGVDVMHLNLHKTFSTPHGGGGPGAGPVAMKKILEPLFACAGAGGKRGRPAGAGFSPQRIDRASEGVRRKFWRAGAGAGVHPGVWPWRAAGDGRRGVECELHPQASGRNVRFAVHAAVDA